MKQRLAQMEAESAGVKAGIAADAAATVENGAVLPGTEIAGAPAIPNETTDAPTRIPLSDDAGADADARSIYVGNVIILLRPSSPCSDLFRPACLPISLIYRKLTASSWMNVLLFNIRAITNRSTIQRQVIS